jgi:hypothetical protein
MTSKLSLTSEGLASASFLVTHELAIAEHGPNPCSNIFYHDCCGCGAGGLVLFLICTYRIA